MSATEQHERALARGNRLRGAAAAVGQEIKALPRRKGLLRLAEILLDPSEPVQRTCVEKALCWVRRVGPQVAVRYLRRAGMTAAHTRRCVGPSHGGRRRPLTESQRRALASVLVELAEAA